MNNYFHKHNSHHSEAQSRSLTRIRGVTLIELIVTIVVLGVAATGILYTMAINTRSSADPMVQEQAILIAEAYMEEILLKKFLDPSNGTTSVCPPAEATRAQYDNVCDYNLPTTGSVGAGLTDIGARNVINATPIPGLESYNVSVNVASDTGVAIGPPASSITNTATSVRVLRVDVRVTHTSIPDVDVVLTAYRTSYRCPTDNNACKPPL